MYRILHIKLICAIGASLFSFLGLSAQVVDTVACKQLLEVEVVSESAPSQMLSSVYSQVAGQADFRRIGIATLDEAVKRMSGVDVRDYGGVGGLKTISVRGLGAKHTAVSCDGVLSSNVQSGQVDIGRFSLENVGQVSLSVGGDDDIFRSATEFASASLLALRTLRPADTRYYVRLRTGSFGLADVSLHHDRVFSDGWSAVLHGNYMRCDGMYPYLLVNGVNETREKRRDSDIWSLNLDGALFGRLYGGDLSVKLNCYNSERGLPGAVNLYNKENRERLWDDNFSVQACYENSLNSFFTLKTRAKYDYHYSEYLEVNKNYYSGQQTDKNAKNECYLSLGVKYAPLQGLSFALTSDATYSALQNNFENSAAPRRFSSVSVLAAKYSVKTFAASVSLLATYIADECAVGVEPRPFKRLSPSVALVYQPVRSFPLRLRASYKDAYRVPTFADLYYLRLGNAGLKPEKVFLYNFGVTWCDSFGDVVEFVSFAADAYYNKVRDKIVALPTMYVWRMMNFGEVEVVGVDVNAQLQMPVWYDMSLMFDVGYSFQHAVDVSDALAKNYRHQLPYTPRHTGKLTFSFLNPYVNLSYLFTAVGERYMLPQNTVHNRLSPYMEHSLSANKEFGFGGCMLRLQGEFLNIGNKQYEIIKYYPMPRFSWRLSVQFLF